MNDGWFVFCLIAAMVLCSGCILWAAIMRAASVQRRREALTTDDLRALEESAVYLIEQMKAEADRAILELEQRSRMLADLIAQADERLSVSPSTR